MDSPLTDADIARMRSYIDGTMRPFAGWASAYTRDVPRLLDEVKRLRAALTEAKRNSADAEMAAAIGESVSGALCGREPGDFMQSFGPVQLAMMARSVIETAGQLASDHRTIEMSGYHDNYKDAARARARVAANLVLLDAQVESFNAEASRNAEVLETAP